MIHQQPAGVEDISVTFAYDYGREYVHIRIQIRCFSGASETAHVVIGITTCTYTVKLHPSEEPARSFGSIRGLEVMLGQIGKCNDQYDARVCR